MHSNDRIGEECCIDGLSVHFPAPDIVVWKGVSLNGSSCGNTGELSNYNVASPCDEDYDCIVGVCGLSEHYGDKVCCSSDGFVES